MKTRRNGYALVEMLFIITVIVVLMALSARPLHMLISEIPRTAETTQTEIITSRALGHLQQDIEQSNRITQANNGTLTLENADGTVTYTLTDGQITRRPGLNKRDAEYSWNVPHVRIEAALWNRNGNPYAVELTTWDQQIVQGRQQRRFNQSMVFFQKEQRQ